MKLLNKEKLEDFKIKSNNGVIDKFLNGEILPKTFFQNFYLKQEVECHLEGMLDYSNRINSLISKPSIEIEFYAMLIWNSLTREERYEYLIKIMMKTNKIEDIDYELQDIFKELYTDGLAEAILKFNILENETD